MKRACLVVVATLLGLARPILAQQPSGAREEIRATLRAFYFNWAHGNWEGLTADILAAKVVTHRLAPTALVAAARAPGGPLPQLARGDEPAACAVGSAALPDRAAITIEGEWAEVSVPRCSAASGTDEFLLIRFQQRWRLVYIGLFVDR